MLERFFNWLNHRHQWECYPDDPVPLTGGEHWYWHWHECRWCDKRKLVLNNSCEVYRNE